MKVEYVQSFLEKRVGLIITFFFICFITTLCNKTKTQHGVTGEENPLDSILVNREITKDTLTILGVGDIMLGTDYPSKIYLPPSRECMGLMRHVKHYLLEADITFGNIEGVFAGDKGRAKHCNNPTQCYVFRIPERYVECLVDADFDLISVANNHVNDFGIEGRKNTSKVLAEAGLNFAGFDTNPYITIEKNGIRYGFVAVAPHTGTADFRDINTICSYVRKLDTLTDIVIVSFHSGAEGKNNQHVTRKDEVFLGYNRGNVYKFSHKVIDAGADIVFGHGPHVTRAVELYQNRIICYSLGNFCTYRRFNLSGPNGYAPIIKVYVDREGKFIKGKAIPIYQEGEGIPKYDIQNRAVQKLQVLTKTDFPEGKLIIKNSGDIYPIE